MKTKKVKILEFCTFWLLISQVYLGTRKHNQLKDKKKPSKLDEK